MQENSALATAFPQFESVFHLPLRKGAIDVTMPWLRDRRLSYPCDLSNSNYA